MSRILVLTTDLPFFPGKMGQDFFVIRQLAQRHRVGVIAPMREWYPAEGVRNLEAVLDPSLGRGQAPAGARLPIVQPERRSALRPPLGRVPARLRWWALLGLLGLLRKPADAYDKLAALSMCAPRLLHAVSGGPLDAFALIQSSLEPWLDYLPRGGGKLVYFHDVRSDYIARSGGAPGRPAAAAREIAAVARQEADAVARTEVAAFVSDLDLQRASRLLRVRDSAGVAPICIDTGYFHPAPAGAGGAGPPVVLFTGHLSHPPNVDAVIYFLREIWPAVRARVPDAVFRAAGLMPAATLTAALGAAAGCELHPNVPDIRPYFWSARAYVVPMRFGGGVRQKILEAWSMRVPVVCTTMAAEGIAARDGEHCELADAPGDFAERVVALLEGRRDAGPMIECASAYVHAHHSIAAAAPRFTELVERAVRIGRRRPYKLLYDLRWMAIGAAGGIEQGAYELIAAIGRIERRNAYRIWAPRGTCSEWHLPPRFQLAMHYADAGGRSWEARLGDLANALSRSLRVAPVRTEEMRALSTTHRLDFDLVHSICGYTHPDLIGHPGILTINDLQHLRYPEFFRPEEVEQRESLYRESALRARHIICISEYTRQDVHRQYGIPLEKMTTVWIIPGHGVWERVAERKRAALLAAMGVGGDYFFYPAHCWPHKNHAALVDAFDRIAGDLPAQTRLVLTGRPFADDHPAAVLIRERRLQARVLHLGFRSPLEIRALFDGCLALVYPSLFEGFGIPVAEAIIAGRPVLCSNATSLPEVAGEAMLGFDPNSTAQIAAAMLSVASRADLRAQLAEASRRRRAVFSSQRRAVETLAVYERVYQEIHGE